MHDNINVGYVFRVFNVTYEHSLEYLKKVSMVKEQFIILKPVSGLPAGGLIKTLLLVGTDGRVELAAMDHSRLESGSRKTVTALHIYFTVGHPCTER